MSEQFKKDVQGIKHFFSDIYAVNLETDDVKILLDEEKEIFAVEFDTDKLSISCLCTNDKERNATMIIKSKEFFKVKKTADLEEIENIVKEILKQIEEKYKDQIIGPVSTENGEFLLDYKENKVTYDAIFYGLYSSFYLKYSSDAEEAVLTKTTVKDITNLI